MGQTMNYIEYNELLRNPLDHIFHYHKLDISFFTLHIL